MLEVAQHISGQLKEVLSGLGAILKKLEEVRIELPGEPSLTEVEEKLDAILRQLKGEPDSNEGV